jgi:hypothetical protein
MPTNVLERLQKRTEKAKQKEARLDEVKARIKEDAKTTRASLFRAGGMYDLELDVLQEELIFHMAVRDHAAANKLDPASLHREILAFLKRKTARDAPPLAAVAAAE